MAPRKRKADEPAEAPKPPSTSTRVTRSTTRQLNSNLPHPDTTLKAVSPKNKKTKPADKKKKHKNNKEETQAEEKTGSGKQEPKKDAQEGTPERDISRTIVIEHCKQCRSFKTRADQVKEGLENGIDGITVVLNPDKPRRGCFEIREEGGQTFISLLDMKRPFKPMKDLDMSKVISDIIDKIKE